jgi:predicted metalloprotease with PDZ domain
VRGPFHAVIAATAATVILAGVPAWGQQVDYVIAFPNAARHEAEIEVTFRDVPAGPLEVRMSRTSPGRYALHEFAKNVYSVRATDTAGSPLPITRPDPHQWTISGHSGTVRVSYTLFADRADGTYSQIDPTHAHLNIPATFMWARGMENAPIEVRFEPPTPDWKIATQLFETGDASTFTAPNLAYFIDSPTELSDHDVAEWTVVSNGNPVPIRLAVHHDGTAENVAAFAALAERVVAEQMAIYGELPDYDNGRYTFIADYLPHASGDAMEHRNSSILTDTIPLATGATINLSSLSHEFFHGWNVERIRPASLEPFDLEAANMSGELWFAEGFTNYYHPLFIRRAGITDNESYARTLSGALNTVINGAGRNFFSPVEMSMRAPFVDAATANDPENRRNVFISYYTWGSAIGLALDLTLRSEFDVTLDEYMQAMWIDYGRPERPYVMTDLVSTLATLTGDPSFATNFFDRFIRGRDVADYASLLAQAGFLLRPANRDGVALGARITDRNGQPVIANLPTVGSSIYEAGIGDDAVIVALDGQPVTTAEFQSRLLSGQPGDAFTVRFEMRGVERETVLTLQSDQTIEVVTFESAGLPITPEIQNFRTAWLASRAR